MWKGSCQCEGVQFSVDSVEPLGVNCYCTICRKISGSPFASVVSVPRTAFRIDKGKELLAKYNATLGFDRWHCRTCFSPIYGEVTSNPEMPLFIAAGALDPEAIRDVHFDHMFVRSLVPWHRILDDRPKHETYPG